MVIGLQSPASKAISREHITGREMSCVKPEHPKGDLQCSLHSPEQRAQQGAERCSFLYSVGCRAPAQPLTFFSSQEIKLIPYLYPSGPSHFYRRT